MKKSISIILNEHPVIRYSVTSILAFIFSLITKLHREKNNSNVVVVLALKKIGDTVFTIPAIKAILENYKEVIIFCYPESKVIYDLVFKNINYQIITAADLRFGGRVLRKRNKKELEKTNPHKIFDLTCTILSASLIINSNTKFILGFNDEYYHPLYSTFIKKRKTPHLIDMYLDVVLADENIASKDISKEHGISYNSNDKILIHPLAGWEAKEWGILKFIELTKKLQSNYYLSWIFPKDKIDEEMIQILILKKIDFIISDSLDSLVTELKQCSLLISNDSGPVHLAAVLGKPTFTIFGPTNPDFIIPFGNKHRLIQKNIHCTPTGNDHYCFMDAGRFCPSYECMIELGVGDVYNKVVQFINELEIQKV